MHFARLLALSLVAHNIAALPSAARSREEVPQLSKSSQHRKRDNGPSESYGCSLAVGQLLSATSHCSMLMDTSAHS